MNTVPDMAEFRVPEDLSALHQWVVWRYGSRDGKQTKVPCQPSGRLASSTDPQTWTSYDVALAAWRGNRLRFAGIGFVFSSEDSYVGIDLDDCLERGQLKPWAQSIVEKLADTYMEISPSGNGIKIWAKARLAGPGKKAPYHDGAIEIYDRGRYFTLTGRVFNGAPMQVKNHQADVDRLYALLTGGTAGKTKSDISDTAAVFEGSRHSYLASIAAQFGARGMAFEEVFAATKAINQSRCKPPKPDKEVRDICQWVWERERCKQIVQMRGRDGAGPVSPAGPAMLTSRTACCRYIPVN